MNDPKRTGAVVAPRIATPTGVALLDALGFKEARHVHGADALIDSVRSVRTGADGDAMIRDIFGEAKMAIAAFSDTIVVSVPGAPADAGEKALTDLAETVAQMVGRAAGGPAPLSYRGCVTFGPLIVDDTVFVGEAIDEAASCYNEALAAVVWLTPAASHRIHGSHPALVDWAVPLRGRGTLHTLVVNPFWVHVNERTRTLDLTSLDNFEQRLLSPLRTSSSIDVIQKYQNTRDFLSIAKAHSVALFGSMDPLNDVGAAPPDDYVDDSLEDS